MDDGRERPRHVGAVDAEDSRRRIRPADAIDVPEVGDGNLPVRRRRSDAPVRQRRPEPGADDPGERAARSGREAGERPRSGMASQGGEAGRPVGNRAHVRAHELDRADVRRQVAGHLRVRPAALARGVPRADDAPPVRKKGAIFQCRALQLDVDGGPGFVGRLNGSPVLVEGPAELSPFPLGAVGHDRAPRVELQERPRGDAPRREIQTVLDRVRPLGNERHEPFRVVEIRRRDRRDERGMGKRPFQNSKPPVRPGVSIQSALSIAPPEFLRQGELRPTELPRYTNTSWAKSRSSSSRNSSRAPVPCQGGSAQPATIGRKAGGQDAEIRHRTGNPRSRKDVPLGVAGRGPEIARDPERAGTQHPVAAEFRDRRQALLRLSRARRRPHQAARRARSGFPASRISLVRNLIDPTTAE